MDTTSVNGTQKTKADARTNSGMAGALRVVSCQLFLLMLLPDVSLLMLFTGSSYELIHECGVW